MIKELSVEDLSRRILLGNLEGIEYFTEMGPVLAGTSSSLSVIKPKFPLLKEGHGGLPGNLEKLLKLNLTKAVAGKFPEVHFLDLEDVLAEFYLNGISWNQSLGELDQHLFKKYELSQADQDSIMNRLTRL